MPNLYKIFQPLTILSLILLSNAIAKPLTEKEIPLLEKKAKTGNDAALDSLFEALKTADGAVAEEIDIAIGKSIEKHPEKFLKHLIKFNKIQKTEKCAERLVGNTGTFNDDEEIPILKKRMAALKTIKIPNLIKTRDLCLSELQKQIGK